VTIIITKSKDDDQFISVLESQGLKYFRLPCIEFIKPSDDYAALDKVIRENHHYDWVFFLSKKSAEVFFSRLLELGGHFFHLSPRLKIACVGQTTADFVINEIGFPVNFMPSKFNSETLAAEFPVTDPIEVILPRAENIDDEFIWNLESKSQVKVSLVHAYATIVPKPSPLEELDALIDSDEELIISLTSSQIVRNFKKIIGANRLQRLSSRSKLRLISIGPETSMTIREELPELALSISEATEASMKSMVDLLMV
jgi:uroporphyrinogen-III synthase